MRHALLQLKAACQCAATLYVLWVPT